ncbi:glutaredoxin domain-containing protein [Haematococcus lacustris]|uniref:Glutaredoxin domain-containing protein n=1 Tax=Haematococcus lacustris TaxID=44745 RepID=A0A699YW23_HAELA|nr:glutaredoxin domain-containing protein [Haematococcus lacustris]
MFSSLPYRPVMEKGEFSRFPTSPGIYAVFDKAEVLQYVGLSRRIDSSVANHVNELPELTHAIKCVSVPHATRESLTAAWKQWVEEAVSETGTIPPGNAPGETRWQSRTAKPARPEIRLTAGKGITGTTMEELVDRVVKDVKVVAFIKGTRTQPQCGFSHKMLTILNSLKVEYEVVNVLDEVHNPGLRDVIKTYSQWPTIPQVS